MLDAEVVDNRKVAIEWFDRQCDKCPWKAWQHDSGENSPHIGVVGR
jgi:hypothetical protein